MDENEKNNNTICTDLTIFGFLLGVFMGFVGFVFGFMFKQNTQQTSSLMLGWFCGFIVNILMLVILYKFVLPTILTELIKNSIKQ